MGNESFLSSQTQAIRRIIIVLSLSVRCILVLVFSAAAVFIILSDALCLEVTVIFPNNRQQKGVLKKMGEDGSITITTSIGDTTYKSDQYTKVESTEVPAEYSVADRQYKNKEYSGAIRNYEVVYKKYKWLNWGENALMGIGNCYKAQKKYTQALETYDMYIKQYARSAYVARVKYNKGLCYRALGEKDKAIAEFNEAADVTDNILTVYSLSYIGELQFEQGQYEEALRSSLRIVILYENLKNTDRKVREAKVLAGKCYDKLIARTTSKNERERLRREKERIIR